MTDHEDHAARNTAAIDHLLGRGPYDAKAAAAELMARLVGPNWNEHAPEIVHLRERQMLWMVAALEAAHASGAGEDIEHDAD